MSRNQTLLKHLVLNSLILATKKRIKQPSVKQHLKEEKVWRERQLDSYNHMKLTWLAGLTSTLSLKNCLTMNSTSRWTVKAILQRSYLGNSVRAPISEVWHSSKSLKRRKSSRRLEVGGAVALFGPHRIVISFTSEKTTTRSGSINLHRKSKLTYTFTCEQYPSSDYWPSTTTGW